MKSMLWFALLAAQEAPVSPAVSPTLPSPPVTSSTVIAPVQPTPPPVNVQRDPIFDRCVQSLRSSATAQGIGAADFDRFTADLAPDMSVLDLLDAQPEFTTPLWDYLSGLVDEQRVSDGREQLLLHRELLSRVSAPSGVDAETIVAVWGVESDYGLRIHSVLPRDLRQRVRMRFQHRATVGDALVVDQRRQVVPDRRGEFRLRVEQVQHAHVRRERRGVGVERLVRNAGVGRLRAQAPQAVVEH